jgi:hypothetical protein
VTLLSSTLWLLLTLAPLVALERWIHRHAQGVGLLVTRDPDLALILYSLVFLPGILIHELSHWVMATILLVRAPRISVWPQRQPDGTLRLGYVETERVDFFRESLIGIAPLVAGCGAILLIGYGRLAVGPIGPALAAGDVGGVLRGLAGVFASRDVIIWLYLIFAISNAMIPSASDRRAWLWLLLALVAAGVIVYWAGFGPFLAERLEGPLVTGINIIASAFSLTLFIDLIAIAVIWVAEALVSRLTRLRVEY